jgi:hypothetical protein
LENWVIERVIVWELSFLCIPLISVAGGRFPAGEREERKDTVQSFPAASSQKPFFVTALPAVSRLRKERTSLSHFANSAGVVPPPLQSTIDSNLYIKLFSVSFYLQKNKGKNKKEDNGCYPL